MTSTFLVLAAGRGSRYGGPKQLAPVGPSGEMLMAYAVHDAIRAGFRHIVVVTAPGLAESIEEHLDPLMADTGAPLELAVQPEPTGTAGAVLAAAGLLKDRFTVCNADDWYGPGAFQLLWSALGPDSEPHRHYLVTYALDRTLTSTSRVSRAVCGVGPDGLLSGIDELLDVELTPQGACGVTLDGVRTAVAPDVPVSTNLWGFQASILEQLADHRGDDEHLLPAAVADLVQSGAISVEVLACDGPFFGITRPEDLPRVKARLEQLVASGVYPVDLRACS